MKTNWDAVMAKVLDDPDIHPNPDRGGLSEPPDWNDPVEMFD